MSRTRKQPGRGQDGLPVGLKLLLLATLVWVVAGGAYLALRDTSGPKSAQTPLSAPTVPKASPAAKDPVTVEPVKEAPKAPERLDDEAYRLRAEARVEATADRVEGIEAEEAGIAAFTALLAELEDEQAALERSEPEAALAGKERALEVIAALACFAAAERISLEAELRGDVDASAAAHARGDDCRLRAVAVLEDWP